MVPVTRKSLDAARCSEKNAEERKNKTNKQANKENKILTMSTCCAQMSLLLWKRRLMAARSWRTTLVEMLIPLLFLFAFNAPGLSKTKTGKPIPHVDTPTESTALGMMSAVFEEPVFPPFGPYSSTYVPSQWNNQTETPSLLYCPNTSSHVHRVMKEVTTNVLSNSVHPIPLFGFFNEQDMVEYYESHPMTAWAGIAFHEAGAADAADAAWSYSIRINGSYAPSTTLNVQRQRRDIWVEHQLTTGSSITRLVFS